MKALIWIIVLLLIGWATWYFLGNRTPDGGDETASTPIEEVQAETSADVDLGPFEDKG